MEHLVIIGNGISGVTVARHVRKLSDKKITIISSESDYFFSRTALMYIYMGHMKFEHTQPYEKDFWEKNNIELLNDHVEEIDFDGKSLSLVTNSPIVYSQLVLAVGSKPNYFGWPGQDLEGVQGLYHYQDLEKLEKNSKDIQNAVIVGGGLIGIELAEMLRSRNIDVTLLVREDSFWSNVLPKQESQLINRHIEKHHIGLRLSTELQEIVADDQGKVSKIITTQGEEIECQMVGLTVGVSPNVSFLKGTSLNIDRGILVNQYLETNIPNVYALGDCAQFKESVNGRRTIEQVWYTGKFMGETLAQTIVGNRIKYEPGHWFNSAKFLDIEYQTYGWVFPKLKDNEDEFYWEHRNGEIAVHFVYNKTSKEFIGVNVFGVRFRHEVFDQWLNEKKSIFYVLEHLKDASFDPEFYEQHEEGIIHHFNTINKEKLSVKKKSWSRILNFISS